MASFDMSWQAPEFEERERDVSWYWISIIIAAVLVAFAVWEKNFLFGLFVVVAEMLMIVWAGRLPRTVSFSINEKRMAIDDKHEYAMSEIESFSVDEVSSEIFAYPVFHFKGKLRPSVQIALPKEQLADFRKNLKTVLKETEYQPTFIDSLEKIIGF